MSYGRERAKNVRVHISEMTKSFLQDEFELEPGNGEQREDYLRLVGMKTFLVKSVLKQLRPDQVNTSPFSKSESDASLPTKGETRNGSVDNTSHGKGPNKTPDQHPDRADGGDVEQLEDVLLERDNEGSYVDQIHPVSLHFTDKKLEVGYDNRRERFSGVPALGLCCVAVFTFLARLCVLPITLSSGLSFGIGIVLLVTMTTFTMAISTKLSWPARMVRCASWVDSWKGTRMLWSVLLVLIVTATDQLDVFGCTKTSQSSSSELSVTLYPADTTCRYPPYLVHTGSLILLGIANLVQIGHVVKLVLVVAITTVYCLLDILVMADVFDLYDVSVYSQVERESVLLSSKYRLTGGLIALAVGVIVLGRQTDVMSRRLFLWTEEAEKQKKQVAVLRIKNEALVYNLLPAHVAKDFMGIRKNDDELYSHAYDEVGVIFAACPNFHDFYNESSVNKNGLECFRFLNEIISDYDELLEQPMFASVSKIKTVGPTYMAASGMAGTVRVTKRTSVQERWRHLDDLVQFAFAMKETLRKINEQSFNNFILRIGINHGPVIAGVIGARKPHYDIWGNTVNVSSRMESTGHAGKIQVVEETMLILKKFGYKFQKRGLIKVKGKGELMTYFVDNRASSHPEPTVPNQVF